MEIEMQAETARQERRRRHFAAQQAEPKNLQCWKLLTTTRKETEPGRAKPLKKSKKRNASKFLKAFFAQVCKNFLHLFVETLSSGASWQRTVLNKFLFGGLRYSHLQTSSPLSRLPPFLLRLLLFHSFANFCIQLMCTSASHAILFFPEKLSLKCDVYDIILCTSNFSIECQLCPSFMSTCSLL